MFHVVENSVSDIDLDDVVWTPSYLVPFSVVKPTYISIVLPVDLSRSWKEVGESCADHYSF